MHASGSRGVVVSGVHPEKQLGHTNQCTLRKHSSPTAHTRCCLKTPCEPRQRHPQGAPCSGCCAIAKCTMVCRTSTVSATVLQTGWQFQCATRVGYTPSLYSVLIPMWRAVQSTNTTAVEKQCVSTEIMYAHTEAYISRHRRDG